MDKFDSKHKKQDIPDYKMMFQIIDEEEDKKKNGEESESILSTDSNVEIHFNGS